MSPRLPVLPPDIVNMHFAEEPLPTIRTLAVLGNSRHDQVAKLHAVWRGMVTVAADHDKQCDVCGGEYSCEWGANLRRGRDVSRDLLLESVGNLIG